jgi:hypothetical protein
MDANLWASIVSKIFETLQEYISQNSKSQQAKNDIEKQLSNELNIYQRRSNNPRGKENGNWWNKLNY